MDQSSQHTASTIDPRLITRIAKGDHQAFSQLYDQSSTILFSLAWRILGNREEAEEVLQRVYGDVWQKVVRYDVGRGTPITWLITLTRGRAIERLRLRGPRAQRLADVSITDTQFSHLADRISGSFESPADQALRNLIRDAWVKLPQPHQRVIELSYYEGLSYTEIATQLNLPDEAVKASLKLGMSQLYTSLQATWEQDKSA